MEFPSFSFWNGTILLSEMCFLSLKLVMMWYWRNLSVLNRLMNQMTIAFLQWYGKTRWMLNIYVYVTGSHHWIHKSSPLHEIVATGNCFSYVVSFSLSLFFARLHFDFDYYSIRVDFYAVHMFPSLVHRTTCALARYTIAISKTNDIL